MTSTALVGSTGLVGSHILSHLLSNPSISSVHAYTRRELPNPTASSKLLPLSSTDTSTWASLFPRAPAPQMFISALGTTRAAAGSVENQRKIDLDLNYDLAKSAKDAGVDTYVLISSNSANATSSFAYIRLKGEIEDRIKSLGFKHTVILRPGLLLGSRNETRLAEALLRNIAFGLRKVAGGRAVDGWAQDADVIARAAVTAGLKCLEGKGQGGGEGERGVWILGQKEIVELGKE